MNKSSGTSLANKERRREVNTTLQSWRKPEIYALSAGDTRGKANDQVTEANVLPFAFSYGPS